MNKIRILHLIGSLGYGGAETMIMNIYRNIDRDRFDFDFFLCGTPNAYYENEAKSLGAKIYNTGRKKKHPFKFVHHLYKTIKKEKYDYIMIHASHVLDSSSAIICKLAKAKNVIVYSHNTNGFNLKLQSFSRKYLNKKIDYKFACSKEAAKWMFGSSDNAIIAPLPIKCSDSIYSVECRNRIRNQIGLKDYHIVIGHIGRFQHQKNHSFLIDIFKNIADTNSKYRLVLIGTGELMPEIENKVKKLNLEDKVIFLGQVPNASRYLSAFDLFILTSYYEGFPTVILESQSNGIQSFISDSITTEIGETDLVHFLPSNAKIEEWVRSIEKTDIKRRNTDYYNNYIRKKYDIPSVVNFYEQFFVENLKNE